MGNVVKFAGKKGKKATEVEEEVTIMVCGNCEQPTFYLAVDGRLFCEECLFPVAAIWTPIHDAQTSPPAA